MKAPALMHVPEKSRNLAIIAAMRLGFVLQSRTTLGEMAWHNQT